MSAYGSLGFEDLPMYSAGAGLRTEYGAVIPPGGRVYYVRNAPMTGDSDDIAYRLISTVNGALGQCRANAGDTVFVLPGHVESIPAGEYLTNLVAGVNIVGLGSGGARPTFTWAAPSSTWGVDLPNVSIRNCVLNLDPGAGTVNVTAPITVTASGCSIIGCSIRMGTTATSKVTIGITIGPNVADVLLAGNDCYGETVAECVTMITVASATRLRMFGNSLVGATTAAGVGVLRFSGVASTNIKVINNQLRNNKALSSVVVTGMAGVSGEVDQLFMTGLSDTGLATFWATPANLTFGAQVYVANTIGERAALFGTASA